MKEGYSGAPKQPKSQVEVTAHVHKGLLAEAELRRMNSEEVRTDPKGIREALERVLPPETLH